LILKTDATTKLFQERAELGYEPALEKATGTLRFGLRDGGDAGFAVIAVIAKYTSPRTPRPCERPRHASDLDRVAFSDVT
jgi:hypothetical protein